MTQLVMFDDSTADGWAPMSLTRPCGELVFGRWTLRERVERVAGSRAGSHVARAWLRRYAEAGAPPCLGPEEAPAGRAFWNSRAVPALDARWDDGPANLWVDGKLAGLMMPVDARPPPPEWFADPRPLPRLPDRRLAGVWLKNSWDLVSGGPAQLAADLAATTASCRGPANNVPDGCWKLGDAPVLLGEGARVEPGALFDTREGPIELAPRVEVLTGTRLAGPLYAGPGSKLLGGAVSGVSAGPFSYLRGEVRDVTTLGYSNKSHDGFLGNSYLGRWVNLGAMTTASNLKNSYGTVRVGPPGKTVDTGLLKFGCLIGDFVKTGIGLHLDTGTVIGAGSNLFGATMPPKWIPPFSWGRGDDLAVHRRDAFVSTACKVAARRGSEAGERFRGWLTDVWEAARA